MFFCHQNPCCHSSEPLVLTSDFSCSSSRAWVRRTTSFFVLHVKWNDYSTSHSRVLPSVHFEIPRLSGKMSCCTHVSIFNACADRSSIFLFSRWYQWWVALVRQVVSPIPLLFGNFFLSTLRQDLVLHPLPFAELLLLRTQILWIAPARGSSLYIQLLLARGFRSRTNFGRWSVRTSVLLTFFFLQAFPRISFSESPPSLVILLSPCYGCVYVPY